MKYFLILLCLVSLLTSSEAAGGSSAKTALRTFTNSTSPAVVSRLVYVFGPHGQDQPRTWLFVTRDAQGIFHEHKVDGRSYAGTRVVPGFAVGQNISAKRWKTDSTTAFIAADKVARTGKRGFEYANLEMRCTELSDRPVWFVTLVNAGEQKVAEVSVSAENGAVLKKNFFVPEDAPLPGSAPKTKGKKKGQPAPQPEMAPPPQGQTQYYKPNQSQPPVSTPAPVRTGLLDNARSGLDNAGHTVQGWFNKLSGRGEPPAPVQPYNGQPVR